MNELVKTFQELDEQEKAIVEQRAALRQQAIEAVNSMIDKLGLTDAEIELPRTKKARGAAKKAAAGAKKPRGAVKVKYRTPSGATWTGRGKVPNAVKAWLEANGKTLADILVD